MTLCFVFMMLDFFKQNELSSLSKLSMKMTFSTETILENDKNKRWALINI